jgi:hypothetical protein
MEAHQKSLLPPDPEVRAASSYYLKALQKALVFSRFLTLVKEKRHFSALSLVARHPRSWGLTARLSSGALFKRIRRAVTMPGNS